jgi:hypothetical protein
LVATPNSQQAAERQVAPATRPAPLRAVTPPSRGVERFPLPRRALRNVLVLSALASLVLVAVVLVGLGGWRYYRTPLAERGYAPAHEVLDPSGSAGLAFGITGSALMLVMQAYSLRKKWKRLGTLGKLPRWLEFHIFCGIVGPVFITFHTSFKFNGIVSVAYWSMLLVVASGFVGRYLFVRIPKSIRGQELSFAEVEQAAVDLRSRLLETSLPPALMNLVDAFEARALPAKGKATGWLGIIFGDLRLRFQIAGLRRQVRHAGVAPALLHQAIDLVAERAVLLRRLTYLKKTKKLFEMWHVFHRPLAYVMLVIVAIHIATVVYLGYAFAR